MEAGITHAGASEQSFPVAKIRAGVDRATVGLAEDQVVINPKWAGGESLLALRPPMIPQCLHQGLR